jgi:hypothetical protein
MIYSVKNCWPYLKIFAHWCNILINYFGLLPSSLFITITVSEVVLLLLSGTEEETENLSCQFENSSAKRPYKIDFVSHCIYLETEI